MSIQDFFIWCDRTAVAGIINNSMWLFPVIMAAHLIGLAWLGATIFAVDLRLIGVGRLGRSARDLAGDLRAWTWGGLGLTLGSGWLLFVSEALRCYESPLFWSKMALLAAALTFSVTIRRRVLHSIAPAPWLERATGATSLALWFGVALAGRGIGFW